MLSIAALLSLVRTVIGTPPHEDLVERIAESRIRELIESFPGGDDGETQEGIVWVYWDAFGVKCPVLEKGYQVEQVLPEIPWILGEG